MFVIFFLVHCFFAFVFFLIQAYLEAGIFLVLGVVSAVIFWPFKLKKTESESDAEETIGSLKTQWKKHATFFFQKMLFPLSLATFYSAIFGIVWVLQDSLGFSVEDFFYGISLLIAVISYGMLSFGAPSERVKNFIFTNISFFLVLWLAVATLHLSENMDVFGTVSAFLFLCSALWVVYSGKFILEKPLILLLSLFAYLFSYLRIRGLFGWYVPGALASLAIVYGIVTFESSEIKKLRHGKMFLRLIGTLFLYLWTLFLGCFFIAWFVWYGSVVFLVTAFFFHLYLHKRFENYASFFLALSVLALIFLRMVGIPESFLVWIFLMGIFSFGLSFFWAREFSLKMHDRYFVQGFSIGIPLISYLVRGFSFGFGTLLEFFSILLFFSALFFVSYLRISSR